MITQANYSKSVMKAMLDRLPVGTIKSIATKLEIPYTTVANVCYGKQYNKPVVDEVSRRYNQAVKAMTK